MSPWEGERTTKQCATEIGQGFHLRATLWSFFLCLLRKLRGLRLRCGFGLPFGLRFLRWCGLLNFGGSFGLRLLELAQLRRRLFAHPRHYAWYAWRGSAMYTHAEFACSFLFNLGKFCSIDANWVQWNVPRLVQLPVPLSYWVVTLRCVPSSHSWVSNASFSWGLGQCVPRFPH